MCYYKTLQLLGAETVKTLYVCFDPPPQNRHISVCGEHTVLIHVCPKRLHRLLCLPPPTPRSLNDKLLPTVKKECLHFGVGFQIHILNTHTHTHTYILAVEHQPQCSHVLTTESVTKLHATISMLSTMLLMGLHWATSAVNCWGGGVHKQ